MTALEEFQREKPTLKIALEQAIYKNLVEMGPNIQGISWFSSRAEEYCEQQPHN